MDQKPSTRRMSAELRRLCGVGLVLAALFAGLLAASGCVTETVEPTTVTLDAKVSARRNLGIDHLRNHRTAMAIRELRFAENLNPHDPETLMWLGEAYRRKGHVKEAEAYLRRSIEENRGQSSFKSHEARMNLAGLLIQLKRYEESIEISQKLIDDPTFATPWRALTNRGWAELQLGRVDDARASFQLAIDFAPSFGPALLNLGIVESKQGRKLAALQTFQRALDAKLDYSAKAETNFRIGELYVSLGKRTEAIQHFEAAKQSSPHDRWGTQATSYLELLQ